MGIFSRFEGKMEDGLEGAADRFFDAPISPVQISKKAEKAMRREKMVGAGKQYAPTLYTVLVNTEDDRRLFGYYPTLAGETETYLAARASEEGLLMDGQPLVRFIADDSLKHGKIEVIAELVSAPIVAQLRDEEFERYGLPLRNQAAAPKQPVPRSQSQRIPTNDLQMRQAAAQRAAALAAQQEQERALKAQSEAQARIRQAQAAQAAAIDAAESAYRRRVRRISQDFGEDSVPVVEQQQHQETVFGTGSSEIYIPREPDGDAFAGLGVSTFEPYGLEPATTQFAAGQGGVNPMPNANAVRASLVFADTNRRVDLASNRLILGRSSKSDIMLSDANASRTHAELHLEAQGSWSITDLGSMNGTYVNGQPISSCLLYNGDRIVIGSTELFFILS